jgi:hypothetical protein
MRIVQSEEGRADLTERCQNRHYGVAGRTAPDDDAVLGIVLVAVTFGLAVASGWIVVAILTGLVLVAVILALIPG